MVSDETLKICFPSKNVSFLEDGWNGLKTKCRALGNPNTVSAVSGTKIGGATLTKKTSFFNFCFQNRFEQ